jgi:hypothetical protein
MLGVDDPVLVGAVVNLAADAAALKLDMELLREKAVSGAKESGLQLSPTAAALLADLIDGHYGDTVYLPAAQGFNALARVLSEPGEPVDTMENWFYSLGLILGHERALLGMLALQASDEQAVKELIELFRQQVRDGVLCSGWRSVTVFKAPVGMSAGQWFDGALIITTMYQGAYTVLVPGDRSTVGGLPVENSADQPIMVPDMLTVLDALDARTGFPDRERIAAELIDGTTFSVDAATYLSGGVTGRKRQWGDLADQRLNLHRDTLGMSSTAFTSGQEHLQGQVRTLLWEMLAATVPVDDPATVAQAPDASAMASAWRTHVGDLGHRINESQRAALRRSTEPYSRGDEELILRALNLTDGGYMTSYRYIAPLLTLAALRRTDDPVRPFIAEQLTTVRDFIEEQMKDPTFHKRIGDVELGGRFADLGEDWGIHATRVLSEGHLDVLIADLRGTYDCPSGHPCDPLVSAPGVVAEVAGTLDLREDAARLFSVRFLVDHAD